MKKLANIFLISVLVYTCNPVSSIKSSSGWSVSVLPSSVRLDPVSGRIIDNHFCIHDKTIPADEEFLLKNQVFDGAGVSLHAARGEYVSFQVVLTKNDDRTIRDIQVKMPEFTGKDGTIKIRPELFLEWSVEVKAPSTGYPKASLGTGWYPDALIPLNYIQTDSSEVRSRWTYPLWLPDFNNRIPDQKSLIIWIDQYVPFNRSDAPAGMYKCEITLSAGGIKKTIPVELFVWDFAIPNENRFRACLQHEGFMKSMPEDKELEIYQLLKRNRISMLDPTYNPELKISPEGKITVSWRTFDERLGKYFSGKAFTDITGYEYGPGYGEPIETFVLPFDVYGKHGTRGWPDTGKPDVERNPENRNLYVSCIKEVRDHLSKIINPDKTEITVYLNGLDESYFPEAWSRMAYYGKLFKEYYPEAAFRIDGSYSEEAMKIVRNSISSWASHTIEYDHETIKKYQDSGIKVWLYGPMLYESKINSWVGSSTFIDLPLVNDRAISWSCWKYGTYSWISWGAGAGWINGWYDPESWKDASKDKSEKDSEFTYKKLNGNALLIYAPGVVPEVDSPCPSIRLKMMRDGVQEYEYMRLLAETDGNKKRADSVVNSILKMPFGPGSIGNIDIWSFNPQKWDMARIAMGNMINKTRKK